MKPIKINHVLKNLIIFLVIFAVIEFIYYWGNLNSEPAVYINDIKIKVEIADTPEKQSKGLSDRIKLQPDQGMLFTYNNYVLPKFWMKDMLFSIDIIWIKDNKIIGFKKNVPLPSNRTIITYQPETPINYVLEVGAGFVEKNGIKIGNIVEIKK